MPFLPPNRVKTLKAHRWTWKLVVNVTPLTPLYPPSSGVRIVLLYVKGGIRSVSWSPHRLILYSYHSILQQMHQCHAFSYLWRRQHVNGKATTAIQPLWYFMTKRPSCCQLITHCYHLPVTKNNRNRVCFAMMIFWCLSHYVTTS